MSFCFCFFVCRIWCEYAAYQRFVSRTNICLSLFDHIWYHLLTNETTQERNMSDFFPLFLFCRGRPWDSRRLPEQSLSCVPQLLIASMGCICWQKQTMQQNVLHWKLCRAGPRSSPLPSHQHWPKLDIYATLSWALAPMKSDSAN